MFAKGAHVFSIRGDLKHCELKLFASVCGPQHNSETWECKKKTAVVQQKQQANLQNSIKYVVGLVQDYSNSCALSM